MSDIVSAGEKMAATSVDGLINWLSVKTLELAQSEGDEGMQWAAGQVLAAMGAGSESDMAKIKSMLTEVIELEHRILDEVTTISRAIELNYLLAESHDAFMRVTEKYKSFNLILNPDLNQSERKSLMDELEGYVESGEAKGDLSVIHGVLTGINPANPSGDQKLLDVMMSDILIKHQGSLTDVNRPTIRFKEDCEEYLKQMFLVQYKGLNIIVNIKKRLGHPHLMKDAVEVQEARFKEQKEIVQKNIPDWISRYPASLFDQKGHDIKTILPGETGLLFVKRHQKEPFFSYKDYQGSTKWELVSMRQRYRRDDYNDLFYLRDFSTGLFICHGTKGLLMDTGKLATTVKFRMVMHRLNIERCALISIDYPGNNSLGWEYLTIAAYGNPPNMTPTQHYCMARLHNWDIATPIEIT